MEVLSQAPQPTIKCYHSVLNGKAVKNLYQEFTPISLYIAGRNLLSYNFEKSIDNFGGSFSFTVKEEVVSNYMNLTFMDEVRSLDIIEISESGIEQKIDFIGVVTKVSFGGISSNLTKTVTVSGKSIEWLFSFYNINTDMKACIFQNEEANNTFKTSLSNKNGSKPMRIKEIVDAAFKMFKDRTKKNREISNFVIGDLIDLWYGSNIFSVSDEQFLFPISSNLFEEGKINIIDYIKRLLPSPIYEIFGTIDIFGKPKIVVRKVPYDNPIGVYNIQPSVLTDFTLTKSCEEIYTAFMPYIEGSSQSPSFYMNLTAAESNKEKGYNAASVDKNKVGIYGYQLLTCSFIGYCPEDAVSDLNNEQLKSLSNKMKEWFGKLDDMYNGDITIVNLPDKGAAKIGSWIRFADGLFYINTEKHTWKFGDNPMINYQVSRGGEYINGMFKPLKKLSYVYREFE